MNCERTRADLLSLADGTLTSARRGWVQSHVERCVACAEEYARLLAADEALARLAPEPASAETVARILAAVDAAVEEDLALLDDPAERTARAARFRMAATLAQRPGRAHLLRRLVAHTTTAALAAAATLLLWTGLPRLADVAREPVPGVRTPADRGPVAGGPLAAAPDRARPAPTEPAAGPDELSTSTRELRSDRTRSDGLLPVSWPVRDQPVGDIGSGGRWDRPAARDALTIIRHPDGTTEILISDASDPALLDRVRVSLLGDIDDAARLALREVLDEAGESSPSIEQPPTKDPDVLDQWRARVLFGRSEPLRREQIRGF